MSAFPAAGGTTSASSASMPALLEGHRLDVRISRRGRDDLRVVRLNASTVGGASSRCPHFPPREGRPPRRPKALLSDLAPSENMENWTAYFAPQQADPIPIHCRGAVPGVCIGPKPALCLRVSA